MDGFYRGNPQKVLNRVRSGLYDTTQPSRLPALRGEVGGEDAAQSYYDNSGTPADVDTWNYLYDMKRLNKEATTKENRPWGITRLWYEAAHNEDLLNVGRGIVKKLALGKVNNDKRDLDKIVEEKLVAERILNYRQNLQKLEILLSELYDYMKREDKDLNLAEQKLSEIQNLKEQLKQDDNFFKTEGRNYDIVQEEMYNKSSGDSPPQAIENVLSDGLYKYDEIPSFLEHPIDHYLKKWKNKGKTAINVLLGISNTIDLVVNSITDPDYLQKQAIRYAKDGDPLIDQNYKTSSLHKVANNENVTDYIRQTNSAFNDAAQAYNEDVDFYQNGMYRPLKWHRGLLSYINPDIDWKVKITDPEKINPEWERLQQEYAGSIWHPLYTLTELGSTLSLIEGMATQIAVDRGFDYAARKIPAWVLRNTPYSKAAKVTEVAINAANIASLLGLTRYSRALETAQEAEDAISQRALLKLQKNGVDINLVLDDIRDYSDSVGINTAGLNEQELIGLGIALHVPIDDPKYNESVKESKKGLLKLINANNSLAYTDYLETLPFLSYGGVVFKTFSKFGDRVGSAITRRIPGQIGTTARSIRATEKMATGFAGEDLATRYINSTTNGIIGNLLNKQGKWFAEKGLPTISLKIKHTADVIGKYGKPALLTATMEGIEEGVQHLLLQRYSRGEYDDYDAKENIFNIPEMFNDLYMSAEALSNFTGLNYGDPDNGTKLLRQAMLIGALMGPIFNGFGAIASNITPGENAHIRNYISQLHADSSIKLLIGENYGAKLDEEHIGIFFDALNRGVKVGNIEQALNDYKGFIDGNKSVVTGEYIDRDIQHLRNTEMLFNDQNFNDLLKEAEVTKGSSEHRKLVQIGARMLTDVQTARENISETSRDIDDAEGYLKRTADQILSTDYRTSRRAREENPNLAKMVDFFATLYDKYHRDAAGLLNRNVSEYRSLLNRMSNKLLENDRYVLVYLAQELNKNFPEIYQGDMNNADNFGVLNEDVRKKAIEYAVSSFREHGVSKISSQRDFVDHLISAKLNGTGLEETLKLLSTFKDREKALSFIKTLLGVDIDLNRINGTISLLEEIRDNLSKNVKSSSKDLVEYIRSTGEVDFNVSDLFENYKFDLLDDLLKDMAKYILSQAMLPNIELVAGAFLNKWIDPKALSEAVFGTTENTIFEDEMEEGSKLFTDIFKSGKLNNAGVERLEAISKKIAVKLLKDELEKAKERQRIAHRYSMEDIANTPDIVDIAEQGDPVAELAMDDAINERTPDDPDAITPEVSSEEESRNRREVAETKKSKARQAVDKVLNGKEYTKADLEKERAKKDSTQEQKGFAPKIDENISKEFDKETTIESVIEDAKQRIDLTNLPDSVEDGTIIFTIETNSPEVKHVGIFTVENNEDGKIIGASVYTVSKEGNIVIKRSDIDFLIPSNYRVVAGNADGVIKNITVTPSSNDSFVINDGTAAIQSVSRIEEKLPVDEKEELPEEQLIQEENSEEESSPLIEDTQEADGKDNILEDLETPSKLEEDIKQTEIENQEQEEDVPLLTKPESLTLEEDVPESFYREEDLLVDIYRLLDDSAEFNPNETDIDSNSKQETVKSSRQVIQKFIDLTFFYRPSEDTETMVLKIGKNALKFKDGYTVKPGKEFAEKLSTPGWKTSNHVDVYFVVSSPIESGLNAQDPDNFTVAVVYEDSETKSIYLAAMRNMRDALNNLLQVGTGAEASEGTLDEEYAEELESTILRYYRLNSTIKEDRRGRPREENARKEYDRRAKEWYYLLYRTNKKLKSQIDNDVRKAVFGSAVLDVETEIVPALEGLRKNRMQIIDACLTKVNGRYILDTTLGTKDARVRPKNINYSNGSFNTTDNYNNLNQEGNEFGFGNSIDEIQETLESGKVNFGFGRGWLGTNPFAINDVYDETILYDGTGYAGKLYAVVEGLGGILTPLMLWEQRFYYQYDKKGNRTRIKLNREDTLELTVDPITGIVREDSKKLPSAAEIVLYLITNKLNSQYLPSRFKDLPVMDALKNIIVHEIQYDRGDRNANIPYMKDKEIYYDYDERLRQNVLHVRIDGKLENYTESELFLPENQDLRRKVVKHISRKLHWNTDLTDKKITGTFSENYPELISALREYFAYNPTETEYSLAGVPEFTFKKDDLFDSSTAVLKPKNVSLLAWMIKNGKLLTNVDVTRIFDRPFIYYDGIETTVTGEVKWEILRSESKPEQTKENPSILNKVVKDLQNSGFVKGKDGIKTVLEILNSQDGSKSHGGVKDVVLLDVVQDRGVSDPKQHLLEKINLKLLKIGKDLKLGIVDGIQNGLSKSRALRMYIYNDGTCDVYSGTKQETLLVGGVSGVYSLFQQKGKVDVDKTRLWISLKLGISEDLVVIDGIIKQSTHPEAYGMIRLSVNTLNDELFAQIAINPYTAGRGIGYHEAWHYVNLLLHDKRQRNKIYDEYKRLNPWAKNYADEYIEELLAEEFRKFAETLNENNLTNKIKRFFNKFIKFIGIHRNNNAIIDVYNKIQDGFYKGLSLDKLSLNEFKERYSDGAFSLDYYPGVPRQELKGLKIIDNPTTYAEVVNAITNGILSYFNLNTIEKIKNQKDTFFLEYIDHLKNRLQVETDPTRKAIIKEVIDNPNAFKTQIMRQFDDYGLRPKLKVDDTVQVNDKSKELIQDDKDVTDDDNNENVWDRDGFDISRKENVRFSAKLFLSQIPIKLAEEDADGNMIFVNKKDPLLGEDLFYDFKEAFNLALEKLWNCDSYAGHITDESGNTVLSPSSILYKVQREAQAKNLFFISLYEKLKDLTDDAEDTTIETQIYNALVSQRSNVGIVTVSNFNAELEKASQISSQEDDFDAKSTTEKIDIKKHLNIMFDDTASIELRLLRAWSSNLASNGVFEYSTTKSGNVIIVTNKTLSEQIRNGIKDDPIAIGKNGIKRELDSLIKKYYLNKKLSKTKMLEDAEAESLAEKISNLKLSVIWLANQIGIPMDEAVLNLYLGNYRLDRYGENKYVDAALNELSALSSAFNAKGGLNTLVTSMFTKKSNQQEENQRLNNLSELYKQKQYLRETIKIAKAYKAINPSSKEFNLIDPSGKKVYAFGENNQFSDTARDLDNNRDGIILNMQKSPYARRSLFLNLFQEGNKFKKVLFRGIKDLDTADGAGYIEMSDLEDYISKLMFTFGKVENSNSIPIGFFLTPTMADKKGFYAMLFTNREGRFATNTPHDLLVRADSDAVLLDGILPERFGQTTLTKFMQYFLDELDSLIEYYSEENITSLKDDPKKLRKNFHGKLNKKTGYILFGGNGGVFRYFYDLFKYDVDGVELDLNQYLHFLYQQEVQNPSGFNNDGFNAIRRELKLIKDELYSNPDSVSDLLDKINDKLIHLVNDEFESLSESATKKVVKKSKNGKFINVAVPQEILNTYRNIYSKLSSKISLEDLLFTAIGNHVVAELMSIIEFEKVFTGDPAYYKSYLGDARTFKHDGKTYTVYNFKEKHSDKIKRLGSVLSPGLNLRFDYTDSQLEQLRIRKGDQYTVLNMSDFTMKSRFINTHLIPKFTKLFLVNRLRINPDIVESDNILKTISDIYNEDLSQEDLFNKYNIPTDIRESIKTQVNAAINPYTRVNVSDALVVIRPELYREIRIRLGAWQFEETRVNYIDENGNKKTTIYTDDIAYDLLEKDASWMLSTEKTAVVLLFEAQALKMTYFSHNSEQIGEEYFLNVPIYNKMAMFPLFKWGASSKSGNEFYSRMNRSGEEIDMLVFESAVKVGLPQLIYSPYSEETSDYGDINLDLNANSNVFIDKNGVVHHPLTSTPLNVTVQNLRNLRLLLNTESHDAVERNFGSLAMKLAYSNIMDSDEIEATSTLDKTDGKSVKNKLLNIINLNTELHARKLDIKFNRDTNIRDFIKSIIRSNDLGDTSYDLINHGGKVASLQSRNLFEQAIVSSLNAKIINFETQGGTAIQQSAFGFLGNRIIDDPAGYTNLNNGDPLVWNAGNNSMEVMLSFNFFKNVIPEEEQTTYSNMKQWLINHDIIKGQKSVEYNDESGNPVFSKPVPFGIGYRVPTQGQSSMFSFTVADILPPTAGDLIVVPQEFTAQTGSDYDVDKLYLSTLYYRNGHPVTITSEDRSALNTDNWGELLYFIDNILEDEHDSMLEALVNEFILTQMQVLLSNVIYGANRASIDVIVDLLKSELIPLARSANLKSGEYYGMKELTPYFQSERKREFTSGKQGVAIFALAITNTALTQATHLILDWDRNTYGLYDLDCIVSRDYTYVSDWLSAMLSAHVDVAKDPFIFDLNINSITYNTICFALRSGAGGGALSFICQPILVKYANELLSLSKIYGKNLTREKRKSKSQKIEELYESLMNQYRRDLYDATNQMEDKNRAKILRAQAGAISNFDNEAQTIREYDMAEVFDYQAGKSALKNPNSPESLLFLIKVLRTYRDLQLNVQRLSDLVQYSRIDTKKFGNDVAKQINFINGLTYFIFGKGHWLWKIKNSKRYRGDSDFEEHPNALAYYFIKTGLHSMLYNENSLLNKILKRESFTTTDSFVGIFNTILMERSGYHKIDGITVPKRTYDEEFIKNISKAIDDVLRYTSLVKYGNLFSDSGVSYIGTDRTTAGDKLDNLLYHDENRGKSQYDKNSIFENVRYIQSNALNGEYGTSFAQDGVITNIFLRNLFARIPTKKQSGKISMLEPIIDMSTSKKNQIASAFYQLFKSEHEDLRRLAEDLAFYFYYDSYDTASRDSYFEIVPYSFRSLYDSSLSFALNSDEGTMFNKEQIIDVLFRNNWNNSQIVPELDTSLATRGPVSSIDAIKSAHMLYGVKISPHKSVYGLIFSKWETSPFIKVKANDKYFLYKKVGDISYVKKSTRLPISVYKIYPKAGVYEENSYKPEYDTMFGLASRYEENDLPSDFAPGIFDVGEVVDSYIQTSKDPGNYLFDYRYTTDVAQINYSSPDIIDSDRITGDNNVMVILKTELSEKFDGYGLRNARRITFGEKEGGVTRFGTALNVNVAKNQDISEIIDNMKLQKKPVVTLYFGGDLDEIVATKLEVNDYVKDQLNLARKQELSESELKDHENYILEVAQNYANNIKRQKYIYDLLRRLYDEGIDVKGVFTSRGQKVAEIAVRAAMQINKDIPDYFSMSEIPIGIYIERSFYNRGKNQEYFDYIDWEFSTDYYDVLTNKLAENIDDLETMNKVIQNSAYVENSIEQAMDKLNGSDLQSDDTIITYDGKWTRMSVQNDPESLYIFTDNTDRDSGKNTIDKDSWYSRKYGEGLHYPTMTSAVIRGLDNARPISTQRWYHGNKKGPTGRWTDDAFDLFKVTINDEFEEIISEWNTGKYKRIIYPGDGGLFGTKISNITETRTPKIYEYLQRKVTDLKNLVSKTLNSNTFVDDNLLNTHDDKAEESC